MKKPLSKTLEEEGIAFSFPIIIKNADGKRTYFERVNGYWCKNEYDSDGRETYFEEINGYWCKKEYDSDGNETYCETSHGYWRKTERDSDGKETAYVNSDDLRRKWEYDTDGNETYFEDSDGYWCKTERDSDGRETYHETSDGYWRKKEYDADGTQTYYETSNGDKLGTPRAKYEGKVVTMNLKKSPTKPMKKPLSKKLTEEGVAFSFPISIKDDNGKKTYHETSDGYWCKWENDSDGNETYFEDSDGYWCKREYDTDGNLTYFEDSSGYWSKRECDTDGRETYYENSNGYKLRPPSVSEPQYVKCDACDKFSFCLEDNGCHETGELLVKTKEKTNELTFGDALAALKDGKQVKRAGWNGTGMFLEIIPAGNAMFKQWPIQDCIGIKTAFGGMQPGWLASQTDMLSDDWEIID